MKRDKQFARTRWRLAQSRGTLKRDIAAAVEEKTKRAGERDVVASHQKRLEKKLHAVLADIDRYLEKNKAMVGQIAGSG